jgi:hypothetical protein
MRNSEIQLGRFIKPQRPRMKWMAIAGFGLTLMILGYIAAGFVSPEFSDWYGRWLVGVVALLGSASAFGHSTFIRLGKEILPQMKTDSHR